MAIQYSFNDMLTMSKGVGNTATIEDIFDAFEWEMECPLSLATWLVRVSSFYLVQNKPSLA